MYNTKEIEKNGKNIGKIIRHLPLKQEIKKKNTIY